jgi:hypothetical protein
MTSISFNAVAESGVIKIPAEYVRQIHSRVRVVVFPEAERGGKKSSVIPYFGIDTKSFTFNRDEANER